MYRAVLWIRDLLIATALAWIGVTVIDHRAERRQVQAEQMVHGADESGVCQNTTVSLSTGDNCVVVVR